jgi:hypothetical protein
MLSFTARAFRSAFCLFDSKATHSVRCSLVVALAMAATPSIFADMILDPPLPAGAVVATKTVPGTSWFVNVGAKFWFVDATAAFGHPAFGAPLGPVASPLRDKAPLGITVAATPNILDPDGSGAFGFGSANVNTTSAGVFTSNYTFNVTATATAVPGPHNVLTTATLHDPVGLTVGTSGTSSEHTVSLTAGTEVQSAFASPSVTPQALFDTRFGLGDYSTNPMAFWSSTPPLGIADLLLVSIFEDATHHINATVSLAGSTPDFSFAYTQSATDVVNAIKAANWTLSNGVWTLGSNLSIEDVTITSLNAANQGTTSTIGDALTDQAVAVIPEPNTAVLGLAAIVGLFIRKRMQTKKP